VKNNQAAFTSLGAMLQEPNVLERLQRAVASPTSEPDLVRRIMSLTTAAGSKVPFTKERRRAVMAELVAMTQFFGHPAYFVTVSPGDADHPLVLRLCRLPASLDDPDIVSDAEFPIPASWIRQQEALKTPVAAAEYFMRLIRTLFTVLIGLGPVDTRKKWNVQVRRVGIYGECLAYTVVFEEQARGTLHAHALIFTESLNPAVLQAAMLDGGQAVVQA
jgi:hypothetical protein